jgi:hypothetical protein
MVIVIASKGNKKDQDGEGHVATKFEIKGWQILGFEKKK